MQDFGSGDTSSNLVGGISKASTGIITFFYVKKNLFWALK